jgi:hypothetical protein
MTTSDPDRPPPRFLHEAVLLGAIGLAWLAFGVKIVGRADPTTATGATDFTCYYVFGQTALVGGHIYEAETIEGRRTPYPPPFANLAAMLAMMPYRLSIALFYVASLAGVLLSLLLAVRLAEPTRPLRRGIMILLCGLLLYPFMKSELGHGQANSLTLAGASLALWGAAANRPWLGGLALAVSIGTKPFYATLIPYFIYKRSWRICAACAVGVVIYFVLIPLVLFGPAKTLTFWRDWYTLVLAPGAATGQPTGYHRDHGNSLEYLLYRFHSGNAPINAPAVRAWILMRAVPIVAAMLVAILVVCRGRLERLAADARMVEFGLLVAATLVLTPLNQRHHYVGVIWPFVAGCSMWMACSHARRHPGIFSLMWLTGVVVVALTAVTPPLARWSGVFLGTFAMFWALSGQRAVYCYWGRRPWPRRPVPK